MFRSLLSIDRIVSIFQELSTFPFINEQMRHHRLSSDFSELNTSFAVKFHVPVNFTSDSKRSKWLWRPVRIDRRLTVLTVIY
jgi:hypothetical protein